MARARMALSVDGPSTAVMPIASRMAGKAIMRVVHPHQTVVERPEISGQRTDQRAEDRIQDDHRKADDDGKLRAPDHARPQAATEIVGPEREVGAGRTEFEAHRQLSRVDRRNPRGERRRQQNDAEQAKPEEEQPVAEQSLQRRPRGMLMRGGNVGVKRELRRTTIHRAPADRAASSTRRRRY